MYRDLHNFLTMRIIHILCSTSQIDSTVTQPIATAPGVPVCHLERW